MNTCLGVCYDGPDELCCAGGYMFQKTFLLSNLSMTCCSNLEGQYECGPGEKCVTESYKAYCEPVDPSKDTTVAPAKRQCCGKDSSGQLNCQPFSPEYDPETEQCCGEGEVYSPTVCSKDSGCCPGGYSGSPKCFDHSSEQCCGVNLAAEMPVVCSSDVACPAESDSWRQCPSAGAATTTTPAPAKRQCCGKDS